MTEQKHTPEPWKVHDMLGLCRVVSGSTNVFGWHDPSPEFVANARRIAAAVNACAGLDTEQLEKFGLGTAFGTALFDMTAQRDQLRAALQGVVDAWSSQFERQGHLAPEWCKQARAALAATE